MDHNTAFAHPWRVAVLILLITAIPAWFFWQTARDEHVFRTVDSSSLSWPKAVVREILDEEIQRSQNTAYAPTGYQHLLIEFLDGKRAGEIMEINNMLTISHHVIAAVGSHIIIHADDPGGDIKPYFTVYQHDRGSAVWLILGIFILALFLVGGKKGLRAALALLLTALWIIGFLVPMIYKGYNPVLSSVITCIMATLLTMLLLNGWTKRSFVDVVTASIGFLFSALCYLVLSHLLRVTGFHDSEAEGLVVVARYTGLRISEVLFAGILVSSLGAVMDIAISISASLQSLKTVHPESDRQLLFREGIAIGRDIVGTMANTLVLAFAGGALITMLIFTSYGVPLRQLINSDFVAVEMIRAVTGTMSVLFMVPVSSAVHSAVLTMRTPKIVPLRKGH